MVKNSNKFINKITSPTRSKEENIKEFHKELIGLCVENYKEKKIMYDKLKSIGLNKNNNLGCKNIYYTCMFFKAILDKDLDKTTELKNLIKKLNQETMEKTDEYQENKMCICYTTGEKDVAEKVNNEGSYVEACNIIKKNNDDLERIYKIVMIVPNWF